ncbi:hypothetical protein [Naumannella halotolerans]|uniref:Uncharacterized protein n=1 Tax=Naumannella halotolerans TaxID=993414 RepID=A0A4R7J463_9ACTN|nr:hypothetical protein [Naumannella halotolerans]TDT31129.1 hypothetical protein CLV29_2542 [Naumannella halotolerans]
MIFCRRCDRTFVTRTARTYHRCGTDEYDTDRYETDHEHDPEPWESDLAEDRMLQQMEGG